MIDAVLAETGRTQQRVRLLSSRVVACLLLAAGLVTEVGYLAVWDKSHLDRPGRTLTSRPWAKAGGGHVPGARPQGTEHAVPPFGDQPP